jgi:hypothetical protein
MSATWSRYTASRAGGSGWWWKSWRGVDLAGRGAWTGWGAAGSRFQHQARSEERLQRLQNGDRVAGYRAGFQKAACFFGVEDGER